MLALLLSGLPAAAAGVEPSAHETELAERWLTEAFLGETYELPEGPGLIVRRQEWGTFRLNQAITGTALRIGGEEFTRGIGTHAPSEIVVRLPAAGAQFGARVGVDNNPITGGKLGSAIFRVEVAGREQFASDVMRGSDAARGVEVDLGGAREFVLLTDTTEDGPHSDVVDWAEAKVTLTDGREVWLDELPLLQGPVRPETSIPYSFVYGGRPSAELLPGWEREVSEEAAEGVRVYRITHRDPDSGVEVTCTAKHCSDFPALDWVLELRNTGDADTEPIEAVLPLDLGISLPPGEYTHLKHTLGSSCAITDFLPQEKTLETGGRHELAAAGGRSSNGTLPCFEVDWTTGGAVIAVGWSGQWAASIGRPDPRELRLTAGQQTTRFRLRPGESVRTPRVLVMLWEGDQECRAHNLFRRLMLTHYCPRVEGRLIPPPVAHPTSWAILGSGETGNERNQLEMLQAAADIGAEVYWLDAYWFPKGFPGGVGTWLPRPEDYPNGLRPLSEAAHERGMGFCLWFEPERVARGSKIAEEHPEFCLEAGPGDLLYNLADPAALAYMTDLLAAAIEEHGVDIYREDFNIDPLPYWQAADEPGREGLTEAKWVEGLYTMWDALVERRPGLAIDNCASGGRRIDLETASHAYALWRSDFQDVGILSQLKYLGVAAIASQVQTVGLSRYVPFSTNGVYSFDPYSIRSAMCGGVPLYMDLRNPAIDRDLARAAVAEVKALRPYFLGDLYPLTEVTTSARDWCAYQLDRPETGDGIALYFHRHESPYVAVEAGLRALEPEATYEYTMSLGYGQGEAQRASGAELARTTIAIEEKPGAMLVRYRREG